MTNKVRRPVEGDLVGLLTAYVFTMSINCLTNLNNLIMSSKAKGRSLGVATITHKKRERKTDEIVSYQC